MYMRFVYRREVQGLEASDDWLQTTVRDVLEEFKPFGWDLFEESAGWVQGMKTPIQLRVKLETTRSMSP